MPIVDDMKFKLQIIILSLTLSFQLLSQDTISGIVADHGRFKNLKAALRAEPDSVYLIFLGNSNLNEFPKEILRFRNLEAINFIDFNIIEIYRNDTLQLTLEDRSLARKISKKHGLGNRLPDIVWPNYPVRNKNKIKHIPDEIVTLTKLSSIYFSKHQISRRQKKKLHRLLPNCEIEVM